VTSVATRMLCAEDLDKENLFMTSRETDRDCSFLRSQVLTSIDNTALFTRSTSTKTDMIVNSLKPKAWSWDTKWAYDSDFEEDEMHNQLLLRLPTDAAHFKRISPGKYIFKGQKVDLKIVYGQIFVTFAEDGQVVTIEEFLGRCSEPSGQDAGSASRLVSKGSSCNMSGRPRDAARNTKVMGFHEPSHLCGDSNTESSGSTTVPVASATDTSTPPSPPQSPKPRWRAVTQQQQETIRGGRSSSGAPWQPSPRSHRDNQWHCRA
jgi:hypothetical protein